MGYRTRIDYANERSTMTVIHVDLDNLLKDTDKMNEIKDEAKKSLEDYFNGMEQMVVEIDCPYAQYVEFGSDPANPENRTPKVKDPVCGDMITETNLRFREWAQTKFQLDNEMRKKRGDTIYKQVMENGMKATPFLRPAEYVVTEDFKSNPDKYLVGGKNPSELLCNEMAAQMAYQLERNSSLVSGDLMRSIRVVKASEMRKEEPPQDLKDIQDYIWEDMSLDRHGRRIRK